MSAGGGLPAPQAARVHPQDLERLADLVADRLSGPPAPRPSSGLPHDERLLSAREVADRYGVTAQWVRKHAQDLGALRPGTGPRPRLKFVPALIAELLASCSVPRGSSRTNSPVRAVHSRPLDSSNLGTTVDLLPIRGHERAASSPRKPSGPKP